MSTDMYRTKLIERQVAEGWSDRAMARQLGVHHTTWHYVKRGERGMGTRFLRHAMRRFPEYDAYLVFFLRADVPDRNDEDHPKEQVA